VAVEGGRYDEQTEAVRIIDDFAGAAAVKLRFQPSPAQ
jgi:hypothetical protein